MLKFVRTVIERFVCTCVCVHASVCVCVYVCVLVHASMRLSDLVSQCVYVACRIVLIETVAHQEHPHL